MRAYVRACVHAYVRACVRACVCSYAGGHIRLVSWQVFTNTNTWHVLRISATIRALHWKPPVQVTNPINICGIFFSGCRPCVICSKCDQRRSQWKKWYGSVRVFETDKSGKSRMRSKTLNGLGLWEASQLGSDNMWWAEAER